MQQKSRARYPNSVFIGLHYSKMLKLMWMLVIDANEVVIFPKKNEMPLNNILEVELFDV